MHVCKKTDWLLEACARACCTAPQQSAQKLFRLLSSKLRPCSNCNRTTSTMVTLPHSEVTLRLVVAAWGVILFSTPVPHPCPWRRARVERPGGLPIRDWYQKRKLQNSVVASSCVRFAAAMLDYRTPSLLFVRHSRSNVCAFFPRFSWWSMLASVLCPNRYSLLFVDQVASSSGIIKLGALAIIGLFFRLINRS